MGTILRKTLCLVFLLFGTLTGQQEKELLHFRDIHPIMQEIFEQHIQVKQLDEQLIKRSLKTYIDQFDPDRIYLLQKEVDPYLHLSDAKAHKILQQFNRDDYSSYEELAYLLQGAIERSRERREVIAREKNAIFLPGRRESTFYDLHRDSFAQTEQELNDRIRKDFIFFIDSERRRFGDSVVMNNQESTISLYEQIMQEMEKPYVVKAMPELAPEVRENQLVLFILKSLAKSLDAHSAYFDSEEAYDMKVRLEKSFDGVGLVLAKERSNVIISKLMPESPAKRDGRIQEGDVLLAVNGKSVVGKSLDAASNLLRGEVGSRATLLLERKDLMGGAPQQFHIVLFRESIAINEDRVQTSYIPFSNGIIGKITLNSFYQGKNGISSVEDIKEALLSLRKQGNLRGVILDLRENNGGFLNQAVKVAGLFITNGVVVVSQYYDGSRRFYRDLDGKTFYDGPLVVLTSKVTASAAEIVAQAIKDYGVGIVVGDEKTYGKGTIQSQTVTDSDSFASFKVTVGKYYTVSGETPQLSGVKADILAPGRYAGEQIGESFDVHSYKHDTIDDSYKDSLSDIEKDLRPWFVRYYIPTLQKPRSDWKEVLADLRLNSEFRVTQNKEYQSYLERLRHQGGERHSYLSSSELEDAVERYQTQEAINVVKDMILLEPRLRGISQK